MESGSTPVMFALKAHALPAPPLLWYYVHIHTDATSFLSCHSVLLLWFFVWHFCLGAQSLPEMQHGQGWALCLSTQTLLCLQAHEVHQQHLSPPCQASLQPWLYYLCFLNSPPFSTFSLWTSPTISSFTTSLGYNHSLATSLVHVLSLLQPFPVWPSTVTVECPHFCSGLLPPRSSLSLATQTMWCLSPYPSTGSQCTPISGTKSSSMTWFTLIFLPLVPTKSLPVALGSPPPLQSSIWSSSLWLTSKPGSILFQIPPQDVTHNAHSHPDHAAGMLGTWSGMNRYLC